MQMIWRSGNSVRTVFINSNPSISGILMSVIRMVTGSFLRRSRASFPLAAVRDGVTDVLDKLGDNVPHRLFIIDH